MKTKAIAAFPNRPSVFWRWRDRAFSQGDGVYRGKRVFDIVGAGLLMLLLAPLMAALASAVMLSGSGGIVFRQTRVGQDGQPFTIYKFRSLDASGAPTAVGRFMRRHSLDELPQLFNIVKGDMSLVGPRPHIPGMVIRDVPYSTLVPFYRLREAAKPGLTGWAQANGLRGPLACPVLARSRIEHDLAYVQSASFMIDVKILALTLTRQWRSGV